MFLFYSKSSKFVQNAEEFDRFLLQAVVAVDSGRELWVNHRGKAAEENSIHLAWFFAETQKR